MTYYVLPYRAGMKDLVLQASSSLESKAYRVEDLSA